MARKKNAYELTEEQQKAVSMLVEGHTAVEVAAALNVDLATVADWRHRNAGFVAAYNDQEQDRWRAAKRKIADAQGKAIEKLVTLLDQDPGIAIKAAAILAKFDMERPKGGVKPEDVDRYIHF